MESLQEKPKTEKKLKKFTKEDLKNILGGTSDTTESTVTSTSSQQAAVSDNLT